MENIPLRREQVLHLPVHVHADRLEALKVGIRAVYRESARAQLLLLGRQLREGFVAPYALALKTLALFCGDGQIMSKPSCRG